MSKFTAEVARINSELAKAYGASGRTMAKALSGGDVVEPETGTMITGEEFLEKALQSAGRRHITTAQVYEAQAAIQAGQRPPAQIVKAVMTGTPYWPF